MKKTQATVASRISRTETETVSEMAKLGARATERKAELGIVDPADCAGQGGKSGERRTETNKTIKHGSTSRTIHILDATVATCAMESVSFKFTKIEWK